MHNSCSNYTENVLVNNGVVSHFLFDLPMIIMVLIVLLQVLVNYARSSREAEEVSKEVNDIIHLNILVQNFPLVLGI